MAERQTVSQKTQIGVETVHGTLVAATKVLPGISINPAIQLPMRRFRPQGKKFETIAAPGREWVEAGIEGSPSYSEMQYLLASALAYAAPVEQLDGATPTGAYLYAHNPSTSAEDTVKSLTVEAGSAFRAHRFGYGLMTEFEFGWDQEEVTLTGSMLGRALEDGITLSSGGGVSEIEQVPILSKELDVYLDTAHGSLGTSKLLRVLSGNIGVSGRFMPVQTTNSALPSFATHVEGPITGEATLLVAADATGMAFLTQARAGGTKFLRIQATGPQIYDGTVDQFHRMRFDCAVKVVDIGEFADESGLYAIEFTLGIVHDSTWGSALQASVINKLATL